MKMLKNPRHIALLFVLLIGVISNVFATSLVHDASKISAEKRAVECESIKAWEVLSDAGSLLRRDVNALTKIDFLTTHGLLQSQLTKIAKLDDIKAINIADNLSKRTNPTVPLNQIDLVPSNAKALESVRPSILDEVSNLSANSNLRNPDGLHSFIQNAQANPSATGWKYELDIANQKIGSGSSIEFSRKVSGKEIDPMTMLF